MISRAWAGVERVSTTRTSRPPRTTPICWLKNSKRRVKTRSPTSCQSIAEDGIERPARGVGCARWRRGTGGPRRSAGRHVAAPPPLAGPPRASRGRRCSSCTASRSTAGGTSTSGRSSPSAGIDAHGFDLRGFGGSGGPRASIDRWSQLHDDLEERLVARPVDRAGRPLVLFGHSLGGLISLGYVLDGRARPDLLVLSAPAIGAKIPLWQRRSSRPCAASRRACCSRTGST